MRASYEPTDLAAFSADLASVFRSAVEKAGMRLVVDCPPLGEPVFVDRDMWEKVVLNLLSNAFKFTLEGSIEVTLRREGGAALLRVRDSGTGISEEQLPHIFERFHRVEGARARTHEGTGIGLALVRELVGLHGGRVEVESEPGRGTTFSVAIPLGEAHLPRDRVEAPTSGLSTELNASHYVQESLRWIPELEPRAPSAGEPRSRPEGRPRVLLADDNADMRDYIRRLLSDRYRVDAFADGLLALESARADPPDLILTDVMMPGLDGFGLLKALRTDPTTQAIPVIMVSARAGEEARVEGLDAGVDDYLVKPFGARELLARVAALLEMARMRREAARNERTLRDEAEVARERAITILESITDGFFTVDADWRITYFNAEAERLTGFVRGDVMGRDYWETFPGSAGTQIEALYRAAIDHHVTAEFDAYYEPWGRWFEIRAYPSKNGGLSIYFRDISGRKQAEADRERLDARERQRTAQLQKLAEISIRVSAARDIGSIVGVVSAEARDLIRADAALIRFFDGQPEAGFDHSPAGRVDSLVRRTNRPVRMDSSSGGWLAAPLVGRGRQESRPDPALRQARGGVRRGRRGHPGPVRPDGVGRRPERPALPGASRQRHPQE